MTDWRKPGGEAAYLARRAGLAEDCARLSDERVADQLLVVMRYMQATPSAPADVIHAQLTYVVRDIRAGERLRMKRES